MSLLRRALAGAFATGLLSAGLVTGTATPAAADSNLCVFSGSTRLLTANDGEYKVWIDPGTTSQGLTEYTVCFGADEAVRGALIFRVPVGGTLVPTVAPDASDDACPRLLHIQDPVELMTRFRQTLTSNPGYVCFGVGDGDAIRITLGRPSPIVSPNVDLILDPQTVPWTVYCTAVPTAVPCRTGTAVTINVV